VSYLARHRAYGTNSRKAWIIVSPEPEYRIEAYSSGLRRLGYEPMLEPPKKRCKEGDIVLTWNLHGVGGKAAEEARSRGATVIVTENGWLGNDDSGRPPYALALDGHNGSGRWYVGDSKRWEDLGIDLSPWRSTGDYILIFDQIGVGSRDMKPPVGYGWVAQERVRQATSLPTIVRPHPTKQKARGYTRSLEEDFRGAKALVTWASAGGVKALVSGIPTFYDAPSYIMAGAAEKGLWNLENPSLPDRLPIMHRMAWAQWFVEELASGVSFDFLLNGTSSHSQGIGSHRQRAERLA
jgi:hypothetical protein